MSLLEKGHVQPNQGFFGTKKKFRQGTGSLCLPDPTGTDKEEDTDRAFLIPQDGTVPKGAAKGLKGLGLTDDSPLKELLQPF
jgi:hypothetical protein